LDTDLWGNPRGADGTWDIGANEYTPSSLVLWLSFTPTNWVTTGTITDASGNSNHGLRYSLTNWPSLTNGPIAGMWAGHWSNMRPHPVELNLGDYIAITNSSMFQRLTNGTATIWYRAASNSYGSSELISAHGTGQSGQTNIFDIARSGSENFRLHTYTNDPPVRRTLIIFPDDTIGHGTGAEGFTSTNWTHLAATWNAADNTVVGYYNGTPFVTNILGVPYLYANTNMSLVTPNIPWVGIGCNTHDGSPTVDDADGFPNNGFFVGDIADVRIYNRALSAAEITDVFNYNGGTTPPVVPPAAPGRVIINDVFVDTLRIY
jgi:hypothetical protein